jgi:transcriptional regulator with XRE-family HTH domain
MVDQMGKRIKMARENLGYQMKDLSNEIGVTSSLISQIESGKAYPSIVTLKKIADALRTTVGDLIGENEDLVHHPLLKSSERRFVRKNKKGTTLHLLSYHDPTKQIEPYIIRFKKNGDSEGIMTSNFPGQEFLFALKGRFQAIVDEIKYEINEGDGFYFDSSKAHHFLNTSDQEAELLWVITPNNK